MNSPEVRNITALIVDSDSSARQEIETILDTQGEFALMQPCETGADAIDVIRAHHPAVVFLETELSDMSGFDVVGKTFPVHRPKFVFLSKNSRHALRAFECYAFDYLLKPVKPERLQLTLFKIREALKNGKQSELQDKLNALFRYVTTNQQPAQAALGLTQLRIPVKSSGRIYFVDTADIEYIVASGYYIEIHAEGRKHLVRESLKDVGGKLNEHVFVRIHRSVIISLKYLVEIRRQGTSDYTAHMKDGAEFKISKSYKPVVFDKVGIGS